MAIMYTFDDLKDKIRRYFRFTKEETKAVIISILAYAFIISFRDWGGEEFSFAIGFGNLLLAILIMAITILAHVCVQRVAALHVGFRAEYKLWIYGVLISLLFCILTRGYLWFLFLPGGIYLHMLSQHRLGYFRYGLNLMAHSLIALIGPLTNITLALFFRMIQPVFPANAFIQKVIVVNLLFAIITMLPIPPLDGSRVFFHRRLIYAFFLGVIIGIAVFITAHIGIILTLLGSVLFGGAAWLLYYMTLERKFWTT